MKDSAGNTPLHYAAKYSNFEICKYLISRGCQPALKNNSNQSAYDVSESHVIRQYLLPLQFQQERNEPTTNYQIMQSQAVYGTSMEQYHHAPVPPAYFAPNPAHPLPTSATQSSYTPPVASTLNNTTSNPFNSISAPALVGSSGLQLMQNNALPSITLVPTAPGVSHTSHSGLPQTVWSAPGVGHTNHNSLNVSVSPHHQSQAVSPPLPAAAAGLEVQTLIPSATLVPATASNPSSTASITSSSSSSSSTVRVIKPGVSFDNCIYT